MSGPSSVEVVVPTVGRPSLHAALAPLLDRVKVTVVDDRPSGGELQLPDGVRVLRSSEIAGAASFIAPLPAGAETIAVTAGGQPLAERTRSKPPTVKVLSPRKGTRVGRRLTVNWKATDPDGDPLRAVVEFSADGR